MHPNLLQSIKITVTILVPVIGGIAALVYFLTEQMNENFRAAFASSVESMTSTVQTSYDLIRSQVDVANSKVLKIENDLVGYNTKLDDLILATERQASSWETLQEELNTIINYLGSFPMIEKVIANSNSLSSINAVIVYNLEDAPRYLSGKTVFLPNNHAVKSYQSEIQNDKRMTNLFGGDKDAIRRLLDNHILSGTLIISDVRLEASFTSESGQKFNVKTVFPGKDQKSGEYPPPFYQINGSIRVTEIIRARNGIIYVIDGVIDNLT